MASFEDILLPDIGDFAEVDIVEILVGPGDRVEPEQSLLTLESEKATMEIPAPGAGIIREVLVKVGDKVGQGSALFKIETDGDGAEPAADKPAAPAHERTPPSSPAPEPPPASAPAAPAPPSAPAEPLTVTLPDIGDFSDIPVIEVLVAPGERVEIDQSMLNLESDKATMEIPSPHAGVVESVLVKVGDKLNQGDPILTLIAEASEPLMQESAP